MAQVVWGVGGVEVTQKPVDTAPTDEELEVLLRTGPPLAAYVAKACRSLRERVAAAEAWRDEAVRNCARRDCSNRDRNLVDERQRAEAAEAEVAAVRCVMSRDENIIANKLGLLETALAESRRAHQEELRGLLLRYFAGESIPGSELRAYLSERIAALEEK